jgi:hypothetical protein
MKEITAKNNKNGLHVPLAARSTKAKKRQMPPSKSQMFRPPCGLGLPPDGINLVASSGAFRFVELPAAT